MTHSAHTALPALSVEAPTYVFDSGADACRHVAQQIAGVVRDRNSLGLSATLGLVGGSSPVGVYQELVRLHQENGLDFSRVSIFIVNEYYGLDKDRLQSMRRWMMENFVMKMDVDLKNVHFFDATTPVEQVDASCRHYEAEIAFGDSIFEDTGTEFQRRLQMAQAGILRPEKLLSWYFSVDEDAARRDYLGQGG